ncbi:sulfotransferase [Roseivirga sp.]|uniref:sulfotransferase n=1 Tax=Roseivirga sp. TaxID=1964215 RepID=UPI003B8D2861
MSERQDLFTRLINAYSNRYLELKIYNDLEKLFNASLKKPLAELKIPVPQNNGMSPVILLGMHRSGTTLLSKILRESGVYMGSLRGKDTDESLFFQNVNKAIYKLSGATWDVPEPFKLSLEDELHRCILTKVLSEYCLIPQKTKSYLSTTSFTKPTLFSIPQLWGWKDPRTCFSLPLWLKIFPRAKIIYIQRNGVDVAQSLIVRNGKLKGKQSFSATKGDLLGAFKLWEMYNQECLIGINSLDPERVHTMRYEELLRTPEEILSQVFNFLKLEKPLVNINDLIKNIDDQKAYAFTKSTELIDFYEGIKETEFMKQFGYDNISI